MDPAFNPYHAWLGIAPEEQPPHHYRLLGLRPFESNPAVIESAADRQMAHLRTFQAGKHGPLSQKLLNEAAAARLCLLKPDSKAAYDATLRERLTAAGEDIVDEKNFGPYMLVEPLNESRTGVIYKAKHRSMGRIVALKVLSRQATSSPQFVERFERKMKILGRLSHANLVSAHEAGQRQGTYYLVMEYVDGQNLQSLLKTSGPLPVATAADYILQAARGLAYAQREGVFHRNVKPSNLMVDRNGVVKVVGFGLAHVEAGSAFSEDTLGGNLTTAGLTLGTSEYMSPEQTLNAAQADGRADIYSLGCTLHALLTGRSPYAGKGPMQQVLAHRTAPIPSLHEARPDAPAALDRVFWKMLAKEPDERQQSMEQLIAELEGCRDQPAAGAKPRQSGLVAWLRNLFAPKKRKRPPRRF